MSDDYYKLLGIGRNATEAEIKKAYRKLAMKYHPDHAKGDKGAEDKFKKISEAYAVLSDKEKRQEYDTFGSEGFRQKFSQEDIFRGFNVNDILKEFGFGDAFGGTGGAVAAECASPTRAARRSKAGDAIRPSPCGARISSTSCRSRCARSSPAAPRP